MSSCDSLFDLCIIGAGMIGSSAARHASCSKPTTKVCLIGPGEPKERRLEGSRDIYGAHYDEGRITRMVDSDPVWAALAQKSIARYRQLEKESGCGFYTETGMLIAGTKGSTLMTNLQETIRKHKIKAEHFDGRQLSVKFPHLNLPLDDEGSFQPKDSGHISARNFVRAQQILAVKQGCTILDDVVKNVTRIVQEDGTYIMKVITDTGKGILARKVLLATGAFTMFRDLLPNVEPDIESNPLTVALVEIRDDDVRKLRSSTPLIYRGQGADNLHKEFLRCPDGSLSFYMLPPVKYPDGKYYIKLGPTSLAVSQPLHTIQEVKRWFCEGDPELAENTAKFICSLVKGIEMVSCRGDYCVISKTATLRPYIDMIHSELGVALGGNGHAAKCSDEIGRIATAMMMGTWDSDISKEVFRLRLKSAKYDTVSTSKL